MQKHSGKLLISLAVMMLVVMLPAGVALAAGYPLPGSAKTISCGAGNSSSRFSDPALVTSDEVSVSSVTLNSNFEGMDRGDTLTLTATVLPNDATYPDVTWTSSNPLAATVNQSGVVTAVNEGVAIITATADGQSDTCRIEVENRVTSVTLSSYAEAMDRGDTLTLTATVLPNDATYPTVTWTSSNPSAATVNQSGKVTAVGEGTTMITATADGVSNTCRIEVENRVTSVTLSSYAEAMDRGDTLTLTATVLPNDATYPAVTWTSSKPSVATVSQSGVVTAVGEGTATITATADGVSNTCRVEVENRVTSVTLSSYAEAMDRGDTLTLTATVLPNDATYPAVTWTSSKPSVATVSQSGVVTAVGEGTATITATADGVSNTCRVEVENRVVSVTLSSMSEAMDRGDTLTLTAAVSPDDATYPTVTWVSSDESIATVDSNGAVTAVGEGSATITATADGVWDMCQITVVNRVESVTLSSDAETMEPGDTLPLTVTISPNDATYQTVRWSSSDTSVATVDSSGLVTAVGSGTATITAMVDRQPAVCLVTVSGEAAEPSDAAPSATNSGDMGEPRSITPKAVEVNDDTDTVIITIDVGDLPEGTAAIELPDGTVVDIGSANTVRITVGRDDLGEDGTVAVVALDEEGVALANCFIQVGDLPEETRLIDLSGAEEVGSSLLSVVLWILGGALAMGIIALAVYLILRKRRGI